MSVIEPPAPQSIGQIPGDPGRLPRMVEVRGTLAPQAPADVEEAGVEGDILNDLALKLCNTVPRLTTDWAAAQLKLPHGVVERIFWQLREDHLIEVLGQQSPISYRYAITQRGREFARRLLDVSGYVGPAPVALEAYTAMLDWQMSQFPSVTAEQVNVALSGLVLTPQAVQVAMLAAASGRSLFLFGPPGNGKTTLGRALHEVLAGDMWIPHCISVENNIIRVFDEQAHAIVDGWSNQAIVDQRWIRVRRPFVMAGGEMTLNELDLAYSPALRFYEAPPHVKANGGLFLLDDFGRQHVPPHELLNRWIIPLEHQIDHLTLNTGQKIRIPFRLMLIVATNLKVSDVADPAFLRRMGYRLHLDRPSEHRYTEIFVRYALSQGLDPDRKLLTRLLDRYQLEARELRASEPRDLIERVKDICKLRGEHLRLDAQLLDLAWTGYFGEE